MEFDASQIIAPWRRVDTEVETLMLQLQLASEISQTHPLYGKAAMAIARRADCDDVLFRSGETFAVVHLTFSGTKPEGEWPRSELYESWNDFTVNRMLKDAETY